VIDMDVHEAFTSWLDLIPYLKEPWRRLIELKAWNGLTSPFAYWASHGLNWADAQLASGAPAGSSYELFRDQVLDVYPIRYAILTGQFMPGDMKMQFEFASALASAYNDWLLDNWVNRDSRLLASMHVAPQDPQAAAREIDRLGDHPRTVQVILPIGQWAYGDPFYHPIFEAAERHHLVIAMHHSDPLKSALGRGRYYIEWHVNVPRAAMSMLTSLVCNGVFDKFPSLTRMLANSMAWNRRGE
jgi:predicted TIM-barrel fold metal-dependent hydrolase